MEKILVKIGMKCLVSTFDDARISLTKASLGYKELDRYWRSLRVWFCPKSNTFEYEDRPA